VEDKVDITIYVHVFFVATGLAGSPIDMGFSGTLKRHRRMVDSGRIERSRR